MTIYSHKDLGSQSFMRDPFALIGRMRGEAALVRMKMPLLGDVWLTTTHEATAAMLKDNTRFTQRKDKGPKNSVAGIRWWMPKSIKALANSMLTHDEPDHRRLRQMVDQAFQRSNIIGLEGRIEAIAMELVSALPRDRPFDPVDSFARQLPLAVIVELLGLPKEDTAMFSRWAAKFTTTMSLWGFVRALAPIRSMRKYLAGIVDRERARQSEGNEGRGLIAELVRIEHEGDRLTRDELIAMVFLLLVAGHETTTHLISGGVHALITHPDQRELLQKDWSHLDLAVEELLRFVSPVQMSKPRHVQESGDFFGVHLEKGDLVMAFLAAANADPAVFDKPHDFDITRKPNRHLSFGTGVHFCLGFQLARMEARVAVKTLFEAFPALGLAVPEEDVEWRRRMGLRAIAELPLKTDAGDEREAKKAA